MYQNVSRKYRPQVFKDIIGQDSIVITLKNALRFSKIAPVYLFSGCRGTGKTTFARVFAKALNCEALNEDQEPCNHCPSCMSCREGKSLDVLELDGASNRGIDDIRQINETIHYAPGCHRYKIYIIDEVHMLTKEAFNALLRTLEESPPHVKFFFATTEPHKILPTILSRCQKLELNRLSNQDIIFKLRTITNDLNIPVEDTVFEFISHICEGALRDAESLLDQLLCYAQKKLTLKEAREVLGFPPYELYFQLDEAVAQYNLSQAFQLSQEIFSKGKDLSFFLDSLLDHYRNLLLLHLNLPLPPLIQPQDQTHYRSSKEIYTKDECLDILEFLMSWHKELSRSPFKRITLEMIFLHLIQTKKRIFLPTLIRRLESLEFQNSPTERERIENPKKENLIHQEIAIPPLTPTRLTSEPVILEQINVPNYPLESNQTIQPVHTIKLENEEVVTPSLDVSSKHLESNQPIPNVRKHDIIMRFAAVELGGIFKKE